jgi:hypothetical protein
MAIPPVCDVLPLVALQRDARSAFACRCSVPTACEDEAVTAVTQLPRSLAELTRAVFGEALRMDEVFARLGLGEPGERPKPSDVAPTGLWVGSVGYEKYKDNRDFAARLSDEGVDQLVDVRELPVSRRRGYAKTALGEAMAAVGIEYIHIRALGNPKPYRELYKSGRVDEGREHYTRHLLSNHRDALNELVPLLRDKRTVLMCVEHDATTCHRTVILDALRDELGIELDVAELA